MVEKMTPRSRVTKNIRHPILTLTIYYPRQDFLFLDLPKFQIQLISIYDEISDIHHQYIGYSYLDFPNFQAHYYP